MRWKQEVNFIIRRLIHRRSAEYELDEEIQAHLEMEIAENIARGMSWEEARTAARLSFGNIGVSKEDSRATWGLGSAIAQGEVVPDSYLLGRDGKLLSAEPGLKNHSIVCHHHHNGSQVLSGDVVSELCLSDEQAVELGGYLRRAEDLMGMPVEIEWSRDETGFKLLQSRPLHMEPSQVPDEIWRNQPKLRGQPAGVGWGAGRACVINCECELSRVGPGDILVTKFAGPALGRILTRVAGVVAELGGSTSHLASLARERGIPMILGVRNATTRIPDGKQVAVDGVAGIVRWMA